MFKPDSAWRAPCEWVSFRDAKRIAIDTETRDETLDTLGPGARFGGYIVGVSIAIDGGPSNYYPVRHDDSIDNLDADQFFDWLEYEARHFRGELVGAHINYDMDMLEEELIKFPHAKAVKDIQVAEALIDENQFSYSLETISKKYCGHGKIEDLLRKAATVYGINPKKDLWRLPARFVGEYAEGDVTLPLEILKAQEAEIAKQDLTNIWDLEQDVTPILRRMTRYGVRVDEDRLEACKVFFQQKEQETYKEIRRVTGHDLNGCINAGKRIAAVLKERGIVLPHTDPTEKHPEGQESVKKEVLEALDDPVCKLILRARKFNKYTGTFYNSVKTRLVNGRLHPSFHQLKSDDGGTITGRLSSSDPNIQQQPVRDKELTPEGIPIGKMWRSIYLPDEGRDWLRCDYKAQEPRLFLHYAALIKAPGTREMVERYRKDPHLDPYFVLCSTLEKDHVKIIYLGRSYEMGDDKLRRNVASALISKGVGGDIDALVSNILFEFDKSAPYFRTLSAMAKDRMQKMGYITTLLGRRCRINDMRFSYRSGNKLIQGSAADMTKKAMVDLANEGWLPHMQVHDELNFSVHDEGSVNRIKRIMEETVLLEVPVRVDATVGASWGDAK